MGSETLTKEEFCARFKAYMLAQVGPVDSNGDDVGEYADMAAETYWDDEDLRPDGPEACADVDLSYWED